MGKEKNIILGITGSIAAYKACDILRQLKADGNKVTAVLTEEAKRFITPLALSSLSQQKVYSDLFEEQTDGSVPHIRLAQDADLVLIAPATANVMARIAYGIADDLLTCVCMATRAPIVIAPAMNTMMFMNPVVQENCQRLSQRGITIVDPVEGNLACGSTGKGHLAEINDIVSAAKQALC